VAEQIEIRVPDLGDFEDVEVIEILVTAGDVVKPEDGLITLETDKASMDVPSPSAGRIVSLGVKVGDRVSAGDVIGSLEVDVAAVAADRAAPPVPAAESPSGPATARSARKTVAVPDIGDFSDVDVIDVHVSAGDRISLDDPIVTIETDKAAMEVPSTVQGTVVELLVRAGDKVSEGSPLIVVDAVAGAAPAARTGAAPPPSKPAAAAAAPAPAPVRQTPPSAPRKTAALPPINEAGFSRAHASPSVRRLARELGVDLAQVNGSGPKNRILHDDVKAFVKAILSGGGPQAAPALPQVPAVDFEKFGAVESVPLTRIQKISGPRLQASWINLPHVTQHDLADITELEAERQKLKAKSADKGVKLTPLAFILKACVAALKEHPKVNASLSNDGQSLVYKKYVHLGFAADTPQGLVVPVIRDADKKDVFELARELADLSSAARDGKLKVDQMQGASFTVSSLGGIGGTAFTPIVNAPEVGILGVSRSSMQPVWNGSAFEPRLMLPLSFSYDHRVIDGAYAVRFTTFLSQALADVGALLADAGN